MKQRSDNGKLSNHYRKDLAHRNILSEEVIDDLALQAFRGSEAAKRSLTEHHLPLVYSIILKHKYAKKRNSMTFLDIIQEGNIGLIKAVKKYNPTLGKKFSTHATWWIRREIEYAIIYRDRTVAIAEEHHDLLRSYLRAKERLTRGNDELASVRDIANELQVDVEKINTMLRYMNASDIYLHQPNIYTNQCPEDIISYTCPDHIDQIASQLLKGRIFNIIEKIYKPHSINWQVVVFQLDIIPEYPHISQCELARMFNTTPYHIGKIYKNILKRFSKDPLLRTYWEDLQE